MTSEKKDPSGAAAAPDDPKGSNRPGGGASDASGPIHYAEVEQPGSGHPAEGTALPEASDQAGEGNPDPTSGDPGQKVQDGERQAPLQDGDGAGRPGRGIYSGP